MDKIRCGQTSRVVPKGGVFVAYSRPGELATEAVKEAGEYYKLNVELTAGYVVGKNWAMCH